MSVNFADLDTRKNSVLVENQQINLIFAASKLVIRLIINRLHY